MAKGKRGTGEPYLRGNTYWIQYYVGGKPKRESANTQIKTEAVKLLNKKRRDSDEGKISASNCKIAKLLELHLKEQRRLQRQDIEHVESRIEKHLKPAIGKVPISRFGIDHIEQYIDDRLEAEAAPATINRELAALKTALRIGLEKGLLSRQLRWTKLPEHNIREGFLDYDDYVRLLSELPEELRSLLVFGYHYGVRKAELLTYKWRFVDWFARELRIPQTHTKNKEPKIIPFYGDVEEYLKEQKSRATSEWIFSRDGRPILDFRASWYAAVDRAKLQDSLGWFHDLRRSAARNMVNAGLDQKLAMNIGGWKTDSVFRRYRITPRKDLHAGAAKMDEFFRGERERLKKEDTKVNTVATPGDPEKPATRRIN